MLICSNVQTESSYKSTIFDYFLTGSFREILVVRSSPPKLNSGEQFDQNLYMLDAFRDVQSAASKH